MTNTLSFIQVGGCKKIRSKEESKGKRECQANQNYDLLVGALREIDVGVNIVVVVIGKDGDQEKGHQKNNMFFRLIVNSESGP